MEWKKKSYKSVVITVIAIFILSSLAYRVVSLQKKGITMQVSKAQAEEYLKNGDELGPCDVELEETKEELEGTENDKRTKEKTDKDKEDPGVICIQVLQPARDPKTGECKVFPTPCDVPKGWEPTPSCDGTNNTLQSQ